MKGTVFSCAPISVDNAWGWGWKDYAQRERTNLFSLVDIKHVKAPGDLYNTTDLLWCIVERIEHLGKMLWRKWKEQFYWRKFMTLLMMGGMKDLGIWKWVLFIFTGSSNFCCWFSGVGLPLLFQIKK